MIDLGKFWSEFQAQCNAKVSGLEHLSSTPAGGWVFAGAALSLFVLACYFFKYLPAPGTSIAVLALLGVVISLHNAPRPFYKALYFILAASFLWIEIRAIRKEKADDKARFERTLSENQEQFNATASIITGGTSFCYMEFSQLTVGKVEEVLLFVNNGKYPLYDVTATVIDRHSQENVGIHSRDDSKVILQVGNIPGGGVGRLPASALPFDPDHTNFTIIFNARNGNWIEQLRYIGVGSERRKALKVSRLGPSQEVLYEDSNGFPKDAAGNVNWLQ